MTYNESEMHEKKKTISKMERTLLIRLNKLIEVLRTEYDVWVHSSIWVSSDHISILTENTNYNKDIQRKKLMTRWHVLGPLINPMKETLYS